MSTCPYCLELASDPEALAFHMRSLHAISERESQEVAREQFKPPEPPNDPDGLWLEEEYGN